MKVVNKKIGAIKPYAKNPRKNDDAVDAVMKSIQQFGFKVPIVIDKQNIIVCGHTRHKAAQKLHMEEVPCVVADDLTPEQIKAFRIADNKVSEKAQWDFDLLGEELKEIVNIDMGDFGFDLFAENTLNEEPEYHGAERERTFEEYNLYDVDLERSSEKWQMPIVRSCDHIPTDLLSFNYAKTSTEFDKGIHFYIDDYQFERIWNAPHDYMDILSQYDCVLTPDFSLYTEMPLPMQIWNVYRSKLVGQIMQDYGMQVIPTLQWCRPDSYDFAFDGIEPGGTVSVSTIGVKRQDSASKLWFDGMDEAMRRLKPKTVIVYGGDIGYDFGNANVIYINNHNADKLSGKEK